MNNATITTSDKPWLPTVTEFGLDNGPPGIFIDIPNAQSMLMEISFRAGHHFCPKDKPEIAHFLEHLVLKANKDYPSQGEFSQAVTAKGAVVNASAGAHNVRYWFLAPDFDWQRVFGLMLKAVGRPLFLPEEFASERAVIYQEHKRRLDNHTIAITTLVLKKIGFPALTSEESLACLDSITVDDLKSHYGRTHNSPNARVVIAGCLSPAGQKFIGEGLEGLSLPVGGDRTPMPAEALSGAGLVYAKKAGLGVVHYMLVFVNGGLLLEASDRIAFELLECLWFEGKNSRIYGQARKRGLIYAMSGGLSLTARSGLFNFGGQISPDNLEALVDLILFEIDRLLAGDFSDDEADRCRDILRGRFKLAPLTPRDWAAYHRGHYIDRGVLVSSDYPSRLDLVDGQTVIGLARKIFSPGDWTLGVLGNLPQESRSRIEAKLNQRRAAE